MKDLRLLPYIRALSLTSGDADNFFSNSTTTSTLSVSSTSSSPNHNPNLNPGGGGNGDGAIPVAALRRTRAPRRRIGPKSNAAFVRGSDDDEISEEEDVDEDGDDEDDEDEYEEEEEEDDINPEELSRLEALRSTCPRLRDVYIRDRDRYRYKPQKYTRRLGGGAGQHSHHHSHSHRAQVASSSSAIVTATIGVGVPLAQPNQGHGGDEVVIAVEEGDGYEDDEIKRKKEIEAMDEPAEHWAWMPRRPRLHTRAGARARTSRAKAKSKAPARRRNGNGKGVSLSNMGSVGVGTSDDERDWAERYGPGSGFAPASMVEDEGEMNWRWVCMGVVDVRHVPGFAYERTTGNWNGYGYT